MKKLWSHKPADTTYGVILEIGSGSILASIVASNPTNAHPDIIWSTREFAILKSSYTFDQNLKSLLTALMNVMMTLESEGYNVLREYAPHARVSALQVSISAPWAYTISKIIEYRNDDAFTISSDLIENLVKKANDSTMEVLHENESQNHSQISVMTRATTDITANGYRTMNPIGQKANSISLTQVSAVAQTLITSAITDNQERILPHCTVERYSTMLIFHYTIKELYPTMTEYCLVDLTYEATEIAIVREGVLHYSTHAAAGLNTIVRNIADKLEIPEADARTLLKTVYTEDSLEKLSTKEKNVVEAIFKSYQDTLEDLFHETGDSLSIPRLVFLHGSFQHEQFFDDYVSAAAKAATGSVHTIHTVSHDLLSNLYSDEDRAKILEKTIDTSILMGAQFFHKKFAQGEFIQM